MCQFILGRRHDGLWGILCRNNLISSFRRSVNRFYFTIVVSVAPSTTPASNEDQREKAEPRRHSFPVTMGTSENFCLRWNDFESNVSGAFRELREDSDFFDVTLATSDSGNRTLQAHKVILSACSSFFKQMLRQQARAHAHPHPFIYLRGVSYNDLLSVLDFMYHGEVNVAQDDLNSFLAVAEELQIKGLTNKDQSESTSTPGPSSTSKARPTPGRVRDSSGPPTKRVRKASPGRVVTKTDDDDDDEIKEINVKADPDVSNVDEAVNPDEEGYDDSYGEFYGDDGSGGMEGDGTEDDPAAGGSADGAKGRITRFHFSIKTFYQTA